MEHENIEINGRVIPLGIDETVRSKLMELVRAWSRPRPVVAGAIVTVQAGGNGGLGPGGTSAADRGRDRKGKRKAEKGESQGRPKRVLQSHGVEKGQQRTIQSKVLEQVVGVEPCSQSD